MAELDKSVKFMPPYKIVEKIRREEKKIRKEAEEKAEERGEKKGKVEVAKAMKQEGVSITIIAKISGLPIQEINEL